MATLICSCCGRYHQDTEKENADFGTNNRDKGYGTCKSCAESVSKSFFGRLIKDYANGLKEPDKSRFLSWTRKKQENYLILLSQAGKLTWKI